MSAAIFYVEKMDGSSHFKAKNVTLNFPYQNREISRILEANLLNKYSGCVFYIAQRDGNYNPVVTMKDMTVNEYDMMMQVLNNKKNIESVDDRIKLLLDQYGFISKPLNLSPRTQLINGDLNFFICEDKRQYIQYKDMLDDDSTFVRFQLITLANQIIFCSYDDGFPLYMTSLDLIDDDLTRSKNMCIPKKDQFSYNNITSLLYQANYDKIVGSLSEFDGKEDIKSSFESNSSFINQSYGDKFKNSSYGDNLLNSQRELRHNLSPATNLSKSSIITSGGDSDNFRGENLIRGESRQESRCGYCGNIECRCSVDLRIQYVVDIHSSNEVIFINAMFMLCCYALTNETYYNYPVNADKNRIKISHPRNKEIRTKTLLELRETCRCMSF